MIRINHNALKLDGNKFFFKDKPFTGIALNFENGFLKENLIYIDGIKKGINKNVFLPQTDDLLTVNMNEMLTIADFAEVCYYIHGDEFTGEKFSGYAYEFDGDYCTAEYVIDHSMVDSQVWFDIAGKVYYFEQFVDDRKFIHQISKYDTKSFKLLRARIHLEKDTEYEIRFDINNKFDLLIISDNFFNKSFKRSSEILVPYLKNESEIIKYFASENLFLSGSGITNDFLIMMLENKCLRYVKKMTLWKGVTFDNTLFDMFSKYTNLHEIEIHDEITLSDSDLILLKEIMPVCDIVYGETRI